MKVMTIILLLVLGSGLSKYSWKQPVPLHEEDFVGISNGIHPSNHSSNILLSLIQKNPMDAPAIYGIRTHSSVLQPFKTIDNDRNCAYGSLLVATDNIFFTAASGPRTKKSSTAECDKGITKGCSEIFFRESKDAGETWSNPVIPSRKNMIDTEHRRGASILWNKESGRVYVFYSKTSVFGGSTVSFITRPPGSTLFSPESDIKILDGKLNNFAISSAATINKNGKPLVHLVWDYNGDLIYTSSESTVVWDQPIKLAQISSYSQHFASVQLFTFPKESPETTCALYTGKDRRGSICCAKGKLTSSHVVEFGDRVNYVSGGACRGINKVAIIARTADETIKAFIYDNKEGKVTEIEPPFAGKFLYDFPQIACEVKVNGEISLKAVAYDRRAQKEYLTIGNNTQ